MEFFCLKCSQEEGQPVRRSEMVSLHDYVEMSFPERVMEVMDPHLIQQLEANGRDHILESIISILRIGVTCSSQSPRDRMEMGDAVNQLHSIRNLLLRLDHV